MPPDPAKSIVTDPLYAAQRANEMHEVARYWDGVAQDTTQSDVQRDEAARKRERAKVMAVEFDRWIPGPPVGDQQS